MRRGTRADDHDYRGAPQDCADGAGARRGRRRAGPPDDTPVSNTRGRDRRTRILRRDHCSDDTLSGEAACPRRRSGSPLRLDTARKPWHKRDDRIGSVGASRRSPEGLEVQAPGPHLQPPRLSAYASRPYWLNQEAVDAAAAVDAQNAPTAAWKSRRRMRDSHYCPQPSSFFSEEKNEETYDDESPDLRGFR